MHPPIEKWRIVGKNGLAAGVNIVNFRRKQKIVVESNQIGKELEGFCNGLKEFDPQNPDKSIPSVLEKWMLDKGIISKIKD